MDIYEKELCVKLVIYKDYTEMLHGQQNIIILELRIVIRTYNGLNLLETTTSPGVILIGNFNTPGFDWKCGFSVDSFHLYCELRRDAIYTLVSTSILSAAVICLTCSLQP